MFYAGRDTTSTLLSWTLLLLALHPEVFTKLRQAVIEDIGPGSGEQQIDFAKLKSCKYLQYVLNETLRLFPSVPINNRVAEVDTVLPTGGGPDGTSPIALQAGSYVTYCVQAMHRRKDLWGEDALEFKVQRSMHNETTQVNINAARALVRPQARLVLPALQWRSSGVPGLVSCFLR